MERREMKNALYLLIFSLVLMFSCGSMAKKSEKQSTSSYKNKVLSDEFERNEDAAPAPSVANKPQEERLAREGKNVDKSVMQRKGNIEPGATDKAPVERKLIYTADLTIEVQKFDPVQDKISETVKNLGGYIANSTIRLGSREEKSGTIIVKIPVLQFDRAISIFSGLGTVKQKNVKGQDVTEEYFDTEARLKSAEMLKERYEKLLDKAKDIKDMLTIEHEINRIQTEIERQQGHLKLLNNLVSFSTITLNVGEPSVVVQHEKGFFGILKDSIRDLLENLVKSIAGFIASLGVLIPFAVLIVVAFYVIRFLYRRIKKSAMKQKAKEEVYKDKLKEDLKAKEASGNKE